MTKHHDYEIISPSIIIKEPSATNTRIIKFLSIMKTKHVTKSDN